MALLFVRARDTRVPILHAKAVGEAHVLICPIFDNACKLRFGGHLNLYIRAYVRNHLIPSNVLDGCHLAASLSAPVASRAAAATTSATTTSTLLVLLLIRLLELLLVLLIVPLDGRGSKDLGGSRSVSSSHCHRRRVCR
jgi:hypothetical protein